MNTDGMDKEYNSEYERTTGNSKPVGDMGNTEAPVTDQSINQTEQPAAEQSVNWTFYEQEGTAYTQSGNAPYGAAQGAYTQGTQQGASRYSSYEFSSQQHTEPKPPKKKKHRWIGKAAAAACIGLVFGVAAYGGLFLMTKTVGPVVKTEKTPSATISTTTTATKTTDSSSVQVYDVSSVTEEVMPSVVAITNKGTAQVNTFFGTMPQEFKSSGSGVIIGNNDTELLIATNNHVVVNAETLEITFDDDTTAQAVVKGKSPDMDLAVVSVKLSDLENSTLEHIKVATLGDSTALKVGEPAIAIGNALGYGQSVTAGIISALDREVTVKTDSTYGFGSSGTITNKLIQTDAAINPGNSGGALFNSKGEVIGINSVKYSSEEVEGMGYAIPISEAQPILDDLMNREIREKVDESKRSYLGIRGVDVTQDAENVYGMPRGCFIRYVEEDSAADKAGIEQGDIIVKVGDTEVGNMEELQERLEYYAAGEQVEIVIARNDSGEYKEQTLTVTLDKRPSDLEEN